MATKRTPTKYNYSKKYNYFKELSEFCGFMDVDSAKEYYYSMIRFLCRELRKNGMVRMPDFGDFFLVFHKERKSLNVYNRKIEMLSPKKTIKYAPDIKLKKYFNYID